MLPAIEKPSTATKTIVDLAFRKKEIEDLRFEQGSQPVMMAVTIWVLATTLAGPESNDGDTEAWSQFRGPLGNAWAENFTLPAPLNPENIRWKVPALGPGISAPSIHGSVFILTSSNEDGSLRTIECRNLLDGSLAWKHETSFDTHPKHAKNSFATATSVCANEGSYSVFGSPKRYVMIAMDWEGKQRWVRDLGPFVSQHGPGASPILFEDLVILTHEHDGPSAILALKRSSGEIAWRTERPSMLAAYATPLIFPDNVLVVASSRVGLSGLDARSGEVLWNESCFEQRCVGSLTRLGENLVAASDGSGGKGHRLVAVKTNRVLPAGESRLVWSLDRTIPYCPTSIAVGENLYMILDSGIARAVRCQTGEEVWTSRLMGNVTSSPIRLADRLFLVSETGQIELIGLGDKLQKLDHFSVEDEFVSTPSVARDKLLIRGRQFIWALGP